MQLLTWGSPRDQEQPSGDIRCLHGTLWLIPWPSRQKVGKACIVPVRRGDSYGEAGLPGVLRPPSCWTPQQRLVLGPLVPVAPPQAVLALRRRYQELRTSGLAITFGL